MMPLAAVIAFVLAVYGVWTLLHGDILWGVLLLVLAALIGPGGYSVLR